MVLSASVPVTVRVRVVSVPVRAAMEAVANVVTVASAPKDAASAQYAVSSLRIFQCL